MICGPFLVLSLVCPSDNQGISVHLQDGTVIDNEGYFSTIPEQTVLIFAKEGETVVTGANLIYNALKLVNLDVFRAGEAITNFFEEDMKAKVHMLSKILNESGVDNSLTLASNKEEHPDWFIGIDSNAKTKEEFLKRRCQDRIRNYLYKSVLDWRSTKVYKDNSNVRRFLEEIIKQLKEKLKKNNYCGLYFVRGCDIALCNTRGDFKCSGVWYSDKCTYIGGDGHEINPYKSREHRIIFSTWNLDHRIERSRTIIPAITELVSKNGYCRINIKYLYELLFTTRNLKLVHIICHDKSAHLSADCDLEKLIRIETS